MPYDRPVIPLRAAATLRILFDLWNTDNLRARQEYERRQEEIEQSDKNRLREAGVLPERCRKGLHALSEEVVSRDRTGAWRCRGCVNTRQRNKRRERGLRTPRISQQQAEEIAERYADLESTQNLAVVYSTSATAIARAVRRAGGTLRTQSEAMYLFHAKRNNQPGDELSA